MIAEETTLSFANFESSYILKSSVEQQRLSSVSDFDVYEAAQTQRKDRNSLPEAATVFTEEYTTESHGLIEESAASKEVSPSFASLEIADLIDSGIENRPPKNSERPKSAEGKSRKKQVPTFSLSKSVILSSEERLLVKIEEEKRCQSKRALLAKKTFERSKSVNPKLLVRSTKQLTVPKTPKSHAIDRKQRQVSESQVANAPPTFVANVENKLLKKTKIKQRPMKLTVPEPFSFEGKSESVRVAAPKTLSLAELSKQFENSARSTYVPKVPLVLTLPKSPKFRTTERSKMRAQSVPTNGLSSGP